MKLSSSSPSQNYASEQKPPSEVLAIDSAVDIEKSARQAEKRKKRLAAETEKIRKALEMEITLKLKAELIPRLETEIKSQLAAEYQGKLEQALAESVETTAAVDQENSQQAGQKIKPQSKKHIDIDMGTKQIVEAILFAAEKPMTVKQVQKIYPEHERPELVVLQVAIDAIIEDYAPRPIALKCLASGYRFQLKDGYAHWVSRIFAEKPPKYSRALLETVAIIAYRQPVTRGDIEDIRGVSVSSNIIRTLLDREWIRVIAHKEVPGRPALYGSTKQFLDYFNLSSLAQLPTLDEIQNLDFAAEQQLSHELNKNEMDRPKLTEEVVEQETISEEDRIKEPLTEETLIKEQAIEETERQEQEIIDLVLEDRA